MGATLGKVATSISTTDKSHRLWERGQLVVLLSRTQRARDLIFVGNKDDTLLAIQQLLLTVSQHDEFTQHVLRVLTTGQHQAMAELTNIDQRLHHLMPCSAPLPPGGSGCCHALISTKDLTTTYIGQTSRYLGSRLQEHNSGWGGLQSSDETKRPWAILAFVVGFDGSRETMLQFEFHWKEARQLQFNAQGSISPHEVAMAGRRLLTSGVFSSIELRFVLHATVQQVRAE